MTSKLAHTVGRFFSRSFAIIWLVFLTSAAAHGQANPCTPPIANPIVCENSKPGDADWQLVNGAGSPELQGFATDISVNKGQTVRFKIKTAATDYRLDIYRLGYYAGLGGRKLATVLPSAVLPQNQPACFNDVVTGLVDCGNWSESASWAVPADAVSGIYLARLNNSGLSSHIVFIVRDDTSTSELLFQTSDTTWQAYNLYGGNSLYFRGDNVPPGRAYKVSYNRPFITRDALAEDWLFNAELPMVRWLEANGYNVSYFTGVDSARRGQLILNHKVFLSVGHDEYWSGEQRAYVEAARAAGVNLAFFSGNEAFWKTRWENSVDGSNTPFRTLVTYKESHANAKIDPLPGVWTGSWRDPRFSPPADGGRPENALSGTLSTVNCCTSAITVPANDGKMRFWRNTSVANLAPGQVATLPDGTLGYEWDETVDNGFQPAGLIRLSTTTVNVPERIQDAGSNGPLRLVPGTATHSLTLYRHASGALVFSAGTVQWSWGLDALHDGEGLAADSRMQQATVNLLADMRVQAATLRPGLVPASQSSDTTRPVSSLTPLASGTAVTLGNSITLTGTASDTGGGAVGAVEVSTDGGSTWRQALGRASWSYVWKPAALGPVTIRTRAIDDSGNFETPSAGTTLNVAPPPVLVVTSAANPFSSYYAEILRTEGLNAFTTADISQVTASSLTAYDVVVLGEMALSAAQVTLFTNWVTAGGNLIAMRPDKQLAGLLGLSATPATLSDKYLLIDNSTGPGAGIVNETIQFHGGADLYSLNGAFSLANLYVSGSAATSNPAVTWRSVGPNGGQAAAFTYDLARSIIYTRQGNPAWSGQNRSASVLIQSDDLYFGNASFDPQPDWLDFNKVHIPQADEQQRFFANLVLLMNLDKRPLPRFWYFPGGKKAVIVMTGDDHGVGGTAGRFEAYKAMSPANCSVQDWECIRSTSYIYTAAPLTNAQAAAYTAEGFDVGLHMNLAPDGQSCADWTSQAQLDSLYTQQLNAWGAKYSNVPLPSSNRTHCVPWSDYSSQPQVELSHGIGLDTNYYYGPGTWVLDRPGFFTGSGMPMRFTTAGGTTLDNYQAVTQMTDESNQSYPFTVDSLLDRAVGPEGYYGAFTANMHTDNVQSEGSSAIVSSALARQVPIVSAKQMLDWLDARNDSSFGGLTWNGSTFNFTIGVGIGANGLQAMQPISSRFGPLASLSRNGTPIAYTIQLIKGIQYAVFPATVGTYQAQYAIDAAPPNTTIPVNPPSVTNNTSATFSFISSEGNSTFACSLDGAAFVACSSPTTYSGLAIGGHTLQVRATDVAGNTDSTPATYSWTVVAAPLADFTDSTVADFSAGTLGAATYISQNANGEVTLAPLVGAEFSGTGLPAGWFGSPAAGGSIAVSGGAVSADGALLGDNSFYGPGHSLEFIATFSGAAFQFAGFFGADLNGPPWAIFGTLQDGQLYARSSGVTTTDTVIPGNWMGAPRRFRIDWNPFHVIFSIDGNVVVAHPIAIPNNMRPLVGDAFAGGGGVSMDSLRMSPYAASGTFLSRIFDAGSTTNWGTARWTSSSLPGTSLVMSVRLGNSPVPDGTWTPFSPLAISGAAIQGSSRYLQYRAQLATTVPGQTPTLNDVTIGFFPGVDTTPPNTTITGNPTLVTNSTSATFSFASTEGSSTFACSLDGAPSVACSSPAVFSGLAISGHTFQVRATDAAVNLDPTPASYTWTIVATPLTNLTDSTLSDFSAGTLDANVYLAQTTNGEIMLKPTLGAEFSGAGLPPDWFNSILDAGGSVSVSGGAATLDGALAGTNTLYGPGRSLEFMANFSGAPFQSAGFFGADLNAAPWAIFGTFQDGQLYARSNGPTATDTLIPGNWMGAAHHYSIDWNAGNVVFSIDDNVVATHAISITDNMRPVMVDAFTGAGTLALDWLRMTAYAASGTFLSRIFDAGAPANWGSVAWTTNTLPGMPLIPGTTLVISVRLGNTPVPDGTWTSFSPLAISGAAIQASSRYLQYRAELATTVPDQTPVLNDITIGYLSGPDPTPPDVTITDQPSLLTNSTSAIFNFSSSEGFSNFTCKLDGGAFIACSSPTTYNGLVVGSHTFQVRATDLAGNTDPTPASYTWTIDILPPDTTITSSPPALTSSTSATFSFVSSEPNSGFSCSLDGDVFATFCPSPRSYNNLANGSHTFRVRATDSAGNIDTTPAAYSWVVDTNIVVDTTPPDTTITSSPPALTSSTSATFTFISNEAGSTFACSLDSAAFTLCTTPKIYSGLLNGSHNFRVRATDSAGNIDATPAVYSWTINTTTPPDTTPPDTTITASPAASTNSTSASFGFTATESGSTFACKLDAGAFVACTTPTNYTGLALGSHTFQVRATDVAGNTDATPASYTWNIISTEVTAYPSSVAIYAGSLRSGNVAALSADDGVYYEVNSTTSGTRTVLWYATFNNVPKNLTSLKITYSGKNSQTCSQTLGIWRWTDNNAVVLDQRDVGTTEVLIADRIPTGNLADYVSGTSGPGTLVAGILCVDSSSVYTRGDLLKIVYSNFDTTPPNTTITASPPATTSSTSAAFSFTSTEPNSTFACSLDGAAFAACTSPKSYSALAGGSHNFQVRATDTAGNTDATPTSYTWTVIAPDTTPPDTTITVSPATATNSTSASFSFTSTETGSTFACKLDSGSFAACTSPKSYTGLAVGSHTFQVRATDAAGNTDATPASFTWTIDNVAPNTTITTSPPSSTSSPSASFSFTSTETGSTFSCKIDSGSFAACTSPQSYTGLAAGSHNFQVRAIDPAGNTDATPASYTWTVLDSTPPDTTITAGPAPTTNSTSASFSFTSTETGSTFSCKIDSGSFAACTSPKSYTGLAAGSHTFQVRATDAAGNTDATPASVTWIIDTSAPNTTISANPPASTTSTAASFSFTSTETGSTFACKLDSGSFAACASPKSYTGLTGGSHTFQVQATDPAGNPDATPASYTWTVIVADTTPPDTSITVSPPATTNSTSASFSFTSTETGSTFTCKIDSGSFAACTSPKSYTGLSVGSHTFQVRATDAAGNTDATPATDTWAIDTTAPSTTITANPPATTNSRSASFSFSSSESGSTFACNLDGAGFASCTSPKSYTGLVAGSHNFQVRATDGAGNTDSSPASYTWTLAEVVVCPSSTTVLDGSVRTNSGICTANNTYYEVNSDTSGTREADWYGTITGVPNAIASLKVNYSGKASRTVAQTISIWNWSSSTWVTLDQRNIGTTEILIADLIPSGTLSNYVNGSTGSGDMRVRVRSTHDSTSFYTSGDVLYIEYTNP